MLYLRKDRYEEGGMNWPFSDEVFTVRRGTEWDGRDCGKVVKSERISGKLKRLVVGGVGCCCVE